MTPVVLNRRSLLAAGGSVLAAGVPGLLLPARAQGLAPTPSMSGGSNNYRKGAATVGRIGKGGFWMSGTVRRAGDGSPLAGQRIQIWAHTTEGQEHEPQSHGATLTDKDGKFRLEMPQIIRSLANRMVTSPMIAVSSKPSFCVPSCGAQKTRAWRRTSSFSRPDRVGNKGMRLARVALIWAALVAAIGVPVGLAATSDLLAYRGPVYILAGFAGIIALGLVLIQPLLISGYVPGLPAHRGRRAHHWIGGALVVAVVVHVGGLWITSPPDMIDALVFSSPTPFSPFGVIAMWAIFAVALLAALRRRLRLQTWRIAHMSLAVVIVVGSVLHGMLVEGTMETMTKAALCALVLAAAIKVMVDLRVWRKQATSRGESTASPL